MSTTTQYNPNQDLNRILIEAGASKTVYALVTPETETTKGNILGSRLDADRSRYLEDFRDAWTSKQDDIHKDFFSTWEDWSKPVVDLNTRYTFAYAYPTAGASEALRHLIYDYAIRALARDARPVIHVFRGEYEGYRAMAEAVGAEVVEHDRKDWEGVNRSVDLTDLFLISQPSAIDGNVWGDFNAFIDTFEGKWNSYYRPIIVDITYVGAVPRSSIKEKFLLNKDVIRNVVFSLSKPFGVYYDRVGGVYCRDEDPGLFGNKWFKNLTSLRLGTNLMKDHDVFFMAEKYAPIQRNAAFQISASLGFHLTPSDVYILATSAIDEHTPLIDYLRRPSDGRPRVCLTPLMADMVGTSGKVK